jgi:hypothetical protein
MSLLNYPQLLFPQNDETAKYAILSSIVFFYLVSLPMLLKILES